MEGEFEYAEGGVLGDLAVGYARPQPAREEGASRPDHELADASCEVPVAAGVLRGEALVVMAVPREHDLGAGIGERLPQRRHEGAAPIVPRAPRWVVPIGERATGRGSGKIGPEPALLLRALGAGDAVAVRVQRHEMPTTNVEAVVALPPRPRWSVQAARPVEVVEIPGAAPVVVAQDRTADRLHPAPGRVIDRHDVGQRGAVVL